jgi:hypothetical protein
VVKETDLKSVGLRPRRFEPCCRRHIFVSALVNRFSPYLPKFGGKNESKSFSSVELDRKEPNPIVPLFNSSRRKKKWRGPRGIRGED